MNDDGRLIILIIEILMILFVKRRISSALFEKPFHILAGRTIVISYSPIYVLLPCWQSCWNQTKWSSRQQISLVDFLKEMKLGVSAPILSC